MILIYNSLKSVMGNSFVLGLHDVMENLFSTLEIKNIDNIFNSIVIVVLEKEVLLNSARNDDLNEPTKLHVIEALISMKNELNPLSRFYSQFLDLINYLILNSSFVENMSNQNLTDYKTHSTNDLTQIIKHLKSIKQSFIITNLYEF